MCNCFEYRKQLLYMSTKEDGASHHAVVLLTAAMATKIPAEIPVELWEMDRFGTNVHCISYPCLTAASRAWYTLRGFWLVGITDSLL
jgi:hypothetical protein